MPDKVELAAATGQVERQQHRIEGASNRWIVGDEARGCALRRASKSGLRCSVDVNAGRVEGGADNAKRVALTQKGLRIVRANLDIVASLRVREVGVHSGIRKRTTLRDRLVLKIRWSQVRERIVTGVVVVLILPDIRPKVEDRIVPDGASVGRGDIERSVFER